MSPACAGTLGSSAGGISESGPGLVQLQGRAEISDYSTKKSAGPNDATIGNDSFCDEISSTLISFRVVAYGDGALALRNLMFSQLYPPGYGPNVDYSRTIISFASASKLALGGLGRIVVR